MTKTQNAMETKKAIGTLVGGGVTSLLMTTLTIRDFKKWNAVRMSVNNGEMSEGIETTDLSARGTTQEGSVEAENDCIKRGGNLLQKFEFAARVGEGIIGAVGMYMTVYGRCDTPSDSES